MSSSSIVSIPLDQKRNRMFSGGDDVGALVLDLGTSLTKLGYAGENMPRAVYRTAVSLNGEMEVEGGSKPEQNSKYSVGQSLNSGKHSQELICPVENGIITDFDAIEAVIAHGVGARLGADLSLHPLLVAEALDNPLSSREKLCELLFETMDCPAVFFGRDAMLSALALGRTTALVVECGAGSTRVVPIHDGYALQDPSLRTKLGGQELDRIFADIYERGVGELSKPVEIVPRFRVKRGYGAEVQQRSFTRISYDNVSESYERFQKSLVLEDLKQTVCAVSDVPFSAEENMNIPSFPYELPDGNTISVGPPRFLVPEMLFTPSSDYIHFQPDFDNYSFPGLPTMIDECIGKCDVDLRKDLFANICLVGGVSKLSGLSDRLQSELETAAAATFKVKILTSSNAFENQFAAWVGGSILGSMGTFQQMWFSKSEYTEDGTRLLASRCP